jgi:arylsulfatase
MLDFTPDKSGASSILALMLGGGPGTAHLTINGRSAGEAKIANFGGYGFYYESLDVGLDLGTPVSPDYATPFAFTGKIESVKVDLQ